MLDRLGGWGVVALWGVFNAVLAAVLAGFVFGGIGDSPVDLEAYWSGVGLVFVIAAAAWLARRYQPGQRGWRQPAGTASVVLFAVGALLAWMGVAFGIWLIILGAFPMALAIGLEIAYRRRRA
jgi:hypothetical protein